MAPETAGLSYNGDLHTLACHDKGKAAAKNLAMCHANATRAYLHAQSYACPSKSWSVRLQSSLPATSRRLSTRNEYGKWRQQQCDACNRPNAKP